VLVGKTAHVGLWPQIADWLLARVGEANARARARPGN